LVSGFGLTASDFKHLSKTLVEIVNGDKKYTSQKRADYYVRSGRADYDEKRRLVFREIGRVITDMHRKAEERIVGNLSGREWTGAKSGKIGPTVMQLRDVRDRGIRAVQRKLGMEPKKPPDPALN
jgi:hypothetical protein